MSDYTQIRYERDGAVARVVLDRPQYKNAQSRRMREEMDEAFAAAVADRDVRVIVLAGEGDHFSSGHDLGTAEQVEDMAQRPYPEGIGGEHERSWELNVANSLRWRELPKPTIAAVQGWCIFGGWIIASAMDLIVAADDARFVPGLFQCFTVPWDIGARKTKEILFQSRAVDAHEAERLGFVNMVVPRAELHDHTMALANRIAETDPFLTKMVKSAVNNAQDAMGWRSSVVAAHSTYLVAQLGGSVGQVGGARRLTSVDQALRGTDPR